MSSGFFSKFKQTKFGKIFFSSFKYFAIFLVISSIIGAGILSGIFFAYIDTAGELSPQQLKITDSKTVLLDINQNEFEAIHGSENREWVSINNIPTHLKQAFIAIEDERFYTHHGIDLKRIAGAVITAIKPGGKTYGASTITQQLVKNLTGETQFSLKRKVQEQWRAVQLEKKLSKEQILELYLNIVPLGNGINGVQAAAKTYFNKDVSELTLAESASIVAITKYPVYYDPFKNFENNKKRQEDILFKMKELKYIEDEEIYQTALNEKLNFKKTTIERVSNHSYFTDQVISDVVRDLQQERGYSKAIAEKLVYGGGLKIYTTVDTNIQRIMDKVYTNPKFNVHTDSDNPIQSAMVIIDPKNGQIRGLVGGIGEKKGKRVFNYATQALRSPGSTIKPIAVYAPAIEKGIINPNSVFDDSPMKIGDWEPHNYDNSFWGNITIKSAVTHSRNIIAIKVLQKLGFDDSYRFLKRLGISSLKSADMDYSPLSLGALTVGVSPLEMAAAYVPFANHGIYIKPYTYLSVVDSEGKTILDNTSVESRAVMTERTAYTMTGMMQNVVTSGTGTLARLSKMPAAGKTGTAADMVDKWFIGYTPYYVGAVWYGHDKQHKKLPESTWNNALLIWKNTMEEIHSKLPVKDFDAPKGVMVEIPICSVSGKRATSACTLDVNGSTVKTVSFAKGSEPSEYCSVHKKINICKESNKAATEYCPQDQVEEKSIALTSTSGVLEKCDVHGPNSNKNNTNESSTSKPKSNTSSENIEDEPATEE